MYGRRKSLVALEMLSMMLSTSEFENEYVLFFCS
jgi:hypothetical protein